MTTTIKTVAEYLRGLPADRREALGAVRKVILENLPKGYAEQLIYGMIGYVVPHSLYPAGYHCDPTKPLSLALMASQKNHMALYLMTVYGDKETEQWFRKTWQATGKKLDMGKSCVRFRRLDDLPLDVIGKVIARVPVDAYIARIEKILSGTKKRK